MEASEQGTQGVRGLTHRVERRRDVLRVVVDVPLGELLAYLARPSVDGARYRERLVKYLDTVLDDIVDVGQMLLQEGEEGVVKWFDENKGYGFIRGHDSKDIFVHWKGIAGDAGFKTLEQGQRVTFKRRVGRETFEAVDVTPVASAEV